MFRVFDVSRCHPPSELAVFIPRKRISLPTNRVVIRTPQSHSFPVRCSSKGRIFLFSCSATKVHCKTSMTSWAVLGSLSDTEHRRAISWRPVVETS